MNVRRPHRRSPQWPPAKTKVPSSLSLQQRWSFGELHFSVGCLVATNTLRLILPSWRVGLTKEQMGRTHGQPLSINLMIVMLNVGGEMVHTTWQKAFPIQRSLPNHVLSSAIAFMACKVSTAKKARFLWKQVSSSSTHQCPPKRFLHHLVLTWKAYRIQLHLRVGVILPAYNTFTSDIQSYHIRYPFASIGFAMICLFGTLKQSTSTLYKILHYSYYLIQNASY